MQNWKKEAVASAKDRVTFLGPYPLTGTSRPYGFQVLSSLMRFGDYDTDFLALYGRKLLEFERSHPAFNPERLWTPYGTNFVLNFSGPDTGLDPTLGYLSALGRNPNAAVAAFHSRTWDDSSHHNRNLVYLLRERHWPLAHTAPHEGMEAPLPGHVDLGHALEAATLGVPYDATGLHRQKKNVNVMHQVMSLVQTKSADFHSKPTVLPSMVKIGAGYIDNLHWMLAERARHADSDRDGILDFTGSTHFGSPDLAKNFLRAMIRDGEAHRRFVAAQAAYTTSLVERPQADEVDADYALDVQSYNLGFIDYAFFQALRVSAKQHHNGDPIRYDRDDAGLFLGKESLGEEILFQQGPPESGVAVLAFGNDRRVNPSTITVPLASNITSGEFRAYTNHEVSQDKALMLEGAYPDWREVKEDVEYGGMTRTVHFAQAYCDRAGLRDEQASDITRNARSAYLKAWPQTWDE